MIGRVAIWTFVCVTILTGTLAAQQHEQLARPAHTQWLVSSDLLEAGNMEMDWQINLPLEPGEGIDRMFVFGDYAYILTETNYLFCIQSETGRPRFSLKLARAGLPVCDPVYADNKLFFIVGNELHIVDPVAGVITESRELPAIGRSAYCSVAKNENFIYISGSNNRLTAVNPENYIKQFQVTSDDDMPILSIVASQNYLIFATSTGSVICTEPDAPKRIWQFDGAEGIRAPLVLDAGYVYASSLDTKIYKRDIRTGRSPWVTPFEAGSPLESAVRPGKSVVYQNAGQSGYYAVTKDTGAEVWNLPGGVDLLTEKDDRAYVFALPGVLTVMNNSTGRKMYSLNFAEVTDFAINAPDKMYIGNDDGRVMAIKIK